VNYKKNLI